MSGSNLVDFREVRELLTSEDEESRIKGLEKVGLLGTHAAPFVPLLVQTLHDNNLWRRGIQSLALIGVTGVNILKHVAPLLLHDDLIMRERAQLTVTRLDQEGLPVFLEVLPLASSVDWKDRVLATACMGSLCAGGGIALFELTTLINDENEHVRRVTEWAQNQLHFEGAPVLTELASALDTHESMIDQAIDVCAKGIDLNIRWFEEDVAEQNDLRQRTVLQDNPIDAIGRLGLSELKSLLTMLYHQEPVIRYLAWRQVLSLTHVNDRKLQRLMSWLNSPDPNLRSDAAIGFAHLGTSAAPALPLLIVRLVDPLTSVRPDMARAIQAIATGEVPTIDDPDDEFEERFNMLFGDND